MFVSSVILSAALASTVLASPTARWSRPCSPNVIALATGIHLNIQGQHAEYNGTVKILQIESQTPVNMEDFYIAKGQVRTTRLHVKRAELIASSSNPMSKPA